MLKTNLHFHSAEDPVDHIEYSAKEGIDAARQRGFDVLALTCHQSFACTHEHIEYAAERGILLIPSIEANVYDERGRKCHVLILNGDKESERVRTFNDLRSYRAAHPEAFIIAPHPYFYGNFSLKENLEKHIELFDAIEHSWFYSKHFNRNVRAERAAEWYGKPFIATSDTHFLSRLDTDYALIDAEEKTAVAVFRAIRQKRFQNVSMPRTALRCILQFGWFTMKGWAHHATHHRAQR